MVGLREEWRVTFIVLVVVLDGSAPGATAGWAVRLSLEAGFGGLGCGGCGSLGSVKGVRISKVEESKTWFG